MSLITGALGLVESATESPLLGTVGKIFGFGGQLYPSLDRTLGRFYRAGAPEGFARLFYGFVLANATEAQERQILGAQLWDRAVVAGQIPTTTGGTEGYETGAPVPVAGRPDSGLAAYLAAAKGVSGTWGQSAGSVDWRAMALQLGLDQSVTPTPYTPPPLPGSLPGSTPPYVPESGGGESPGTSAPPASKGGAGILLPLALLLFARK